MVPHDPSTGVGRVLRQDANLPPRTSTLDEPRRLPRRVLSRFLRARVLVALMVVVGVFDLVCTVTAYENGLLDEMNPLASAVLDNYGSPGLAVFRFVATALSCVVLVWALRTYRARYAFDHGARRVRTVIHSAVGVIVGAHLTLLLWWISWLSV